MKPSRFRLWLYRRWAGRYKDDIESFSRFRALALANGQPELAVATDQAIEALKKLVADLDAGEPPDWAAHGAVLERLNAQLP